MPGLSEEFPGQGHRRCGLTDPGASGEEQMGKASRPDIGLEALDDVVLTNDIGEPYGSVFLDPDCMALVYLPFLIFLLQIRLFGLWIETAAKHRIHGGGKKGSFFGT